MRDWAAVRPGRALFLDFDALSLSPNAPPTTRDWDKHYMCDASSLAVVSMRS